MSWRAVGDGERVYRAAYRFGSGGQATCCAIRLDDGGLLLISPPGGPMAETLLDQADSLLKRQRDVDPFPSLVAWASEVD